MPIQFGSINLSGFVLESGNYNNPRTSEIDEHGLRAYENVRYLIAGSDYLRDKFESGDSSTSLTVTRTPSEQEDANDPAQDMYTFEVKGLDKEGTGFVSEWKESFINWALTPGKGASDYTFVEPLGKAIHRIILRARTNEKENGIVLGNTLMPPAEHERFLTLESGARQQVYAALKAELEEQLV